MSTCYRHTDRETYINCSRCGKFICPDCMVSAPVGFQCVDCVQESNQQQPRVRYVNRSSQLPTATRYIIGLCVGAFLYTVLNGNALNNFAMFPPAIASGQWWRLISAAFLHGGIFHIAFNMYALYWLGPALENVLGKTKFVALYLLAALGGNVASYYFSDIATVSVGASGAIFGLMTATIVIGRELRADTSQLMTLLAINVVIGFLNPAIDWRAHLGGALVGAALAYAQTSRRREIQIFGFVAITLILVALVILRTHSILSAFQ